MPNGLERGTITCVETFLMKRDNGRPYHWRVGLPERTGKGFDTWIRLETNDGVEGWAFVGHYGAATAQITRDMVADRILGHSALRTEELWHWIFELDRLEEYPIWMFGSIDVAAWDIKAKYAGMPLYLLLGGARTEIPSYASLTTYFDDQELLDTCRALVDIGYTAIKLHGVGEVKWAIRQAEMVRELVGPDFVLMEDASGGYDYLDALRYGRVLDTLDFFWYEEPMRDFSIGAHAQLAAELKVPILGAETADGAHFNASEWIARRGCDIMRTCVEHKGGITGGLKVAQLAESFEMRAEVHGGALPNIHLICAIPNTTYYEALVYGRDEAAIESVKALQTVSPPQVPGIGWEVDAEDLRKTAYATSVARL